MKAIIVMMLVASLFKADQVLFDFNTAETSGKWYTVNDGVMGGVSQSTFELTEEGYANFSGTLSGDNNGGFASVRAMVDMGSEEKYKGVIVRVKGDGNKYSLRFRTSSNFDGYAYQAKFQTEENEWKEFKIPFSSFEPTWRGQTLSGKPELESQNIAQIGILIADYQFGKFSMDMDWIKMY